jgi:hypothetical protein
MTDTEFIFALIGAVATTLGLGWGVFTFFFSDFQEYKSKKILDEAFGQGPYDKATIERSTKYYVRPKCSNIDPAQEAEPRHALMATREDLFSKVKYFLQKDETHRHLLILADSGMGKTSFVLNYYAYNHQLPRKRRQKIAIVPLGIKNPDLLILEIPDPHETILMLDAFDEDTRAIRDHRARIRSLMGICDRFMKVIITCRTQFFPRDEEIPVKTGVLRFSPTAAGIKKEYEFWKLYLSPFDDRDVNAYVRKRFPFWHFAERKQATELALKIPMLSIRPMLLAHIPDLIRSNPNIDNSSQLYDAMIEAWLDRESFWVNKKILRAHSEMLAVEIFRHRERRGAELITARELSDLSAKWGIDIEKWKLTNRSLLNRDAQGNYKFAHRSIMEFLFIIRLLKGDEGCSDITLTDQMKFFLAEKLGVVWPQCLLINDLQGNDLDKQDRNRRLESWDRCWLEWMVGETGIHRLLTKIAPNSYLPDQRITDQIATALVRSWKDDGLVSSFPIEKLITNILRTEMEKCISLSDNPGNFDLGDAITDWLSTLSVAQIQTILSINSVSKKKLTHQQAVRVTEDIFFLAGIDKPEDRERLLQDLEDFAKMFGTEELDAFILLNRKYLGGRGYAILPPLLYRQHFALMRW